MNELQITGKNILALAMGNSRVLSAMDETLQTHLEIIALGVHSMTLGSWLEDYKTSLQSAIAIIQTILKAN